MTPASVRTSPLALPMSQTLDRLSAKVMQALREVGVSSCWEVKPRQVVQPVRQPPTHFPKRVGIPTFSTALAKTSKPSTGSRMTLPETNEVSGGQ